MLLLDLFCGAGGAAVGYHRAGFEVIGVDNKQQLNYPYLFAQHTAQHVLLDLLDGLPVVVSNHKTPLSREIRIERQYYLEDFDAIHASPPCQKWAIIGQAYEHSHSDQITPIRELLLQTGLPYVIENVVKAPLLLDKSILLCGSSFGLGLHRHRRFESNVKLFDLPCRHEWQLPRFKNYDHGRSQYARIVKVYGNGSLKSNEYWAREMEIDWMNRIEITQAIPPAYTRYIGAQLMAHIECRANERNPFAKLVNHA